MVLVLLFAFYGNELFMQIFSGIVILTNLATIIYMILIDKRPPQKTLLWFITIIAFPTLGFIFYLYLGKGPSIRKRKELLKKILSDEKYYCEVKKQTDFLNSTDSKKSTLSNELIKFNLEHNKSVCTFLNDVKIYTDMQEHYSEMLKDILNANDSINFQYFIIKPDSTGKAFRDALVEKAKQGVKVRVVYDDFGSIKIRKNFFKELTINGGEVYRFFPSIFRLFSRNINYRNHRKIVVIDDKIAYTGGANIGDEYASKHKKITPWRDTHLRITGRSVDLLNIRFMQDYNFSAKKEDKITVQEELSTNNIMPVQIVSSGPDEATFGIEKAYIKAIYSAKERLYIQTPYFVPSSSMMDALKIAVKSGVDVRVMIPGVPDKKYAYHCTTGYAGELVRAGVKVYMYNGFLHGKTMLIDDEISSVGTVNLDYRSFNLHFEVTTFIYDKEFCGKMLEIFNEDINNSLPLDDEYLKNRSLSQRFGERIMRLFSEVL